MIRGLEPPDLETVVDIHVTSWSPRELSVKLGRDFVGAFYRRVLASSHAFGYVNQDPGGEIAGYAVGFSDYAEFNRELVAALSWAKYTLVLRGLLAGRINPADIINLLLDRRKLRRARFPQYHLGAIALAPEFKKTPAGGAAVMNLMNAVEQRLQAAGAPGMWGLCDAVNVPMRRFMARRGFEEVDVIRFVGRAVVLSEKSFSPC